MKKIFSLHKIFFSILFFIVTVALHQILLTQQANASVHYIWRPAGVNTNWSNANNWRISTYSGTTASNAPLAADTAEIGNSTTNFTVVLDVDTAISVLLITNGGQIFLNTSTNKTLRVTGNIFSTNTNTTGGGSATIKLTGTANVTLNGNTSAINKGKFCNITIDKSAGSVTLVNYITMGGSTKLKYMTADSIVPGTSTVALYNTNTLEGSLTFYNLEFMGTSSTCTISSNQTVRHNLTTSGTSSLLINSNQIDVQGDININNSAASGGGSTILNLTGTNNQTIASTVSLGQGYIGSLKFSKTSGSLSFNGVISMTGNFTNNYSSDTSIIHFGTAELFFAGTATIGGTYTTTLYRVTTGSSNSMYITFSKDTAIIVKNKFRTKGTANLKLNNYSIVVEGDIQIDNTYFQSGGTTEIRIGGSANQTFTSNVSAGQGFLPSLKIQKSGGTLSFIGTINLLGDWTNNYSSDTSIMKFGTSTLYLNNFSNCTHLVGGNYSTSLYDMTLGYSGTRNTYDFTKDTAICIRHLMHTVGNFTVSMINHSILVLGDIQIDNSYFLSGGTTVIIMGGSANQSITSTATGGNGNLSGLKIQKSSGTLSLSGVISLTGNFTNNYSSSSSDILYGTSELFFFTNSGTFTLGGSYSTPLYRLTFMGPAVYNLTLDSAFIVNDTFKTIGQTYVTVNYYSMVLKGNIVNRNNNAGSISIIGSTVYLKGAANQYFKGDYSLKFNSIVMNKSAGTFTLNKNLTIANNLTFNTGNIVSSLSNLLIFNDNATVTGASNNSFVSGPVRKIGNDPFKFPIGKGTSYKPDSMSTPTSGTDTYTSEYFDSTNANTTLDGVLTYRDKCEFWNLTHNSGSGSVNVKLYWNNPCFHIASLSYFKVGYVSSGTWTSAGTCTTTGNTTTGTITSNTARTTWGDITLAKTNPLVVLNAGTDQAICNGSNVSIGNAATGGTPTITYSWSPTTGLSSSTINNPTASPTVTTSYVVTATDALTEFAKDTVTVTVNSNPVAHAGSDLAICNGSSTSIGSVATSGTSPYSYAWSPTTGLSSATVASPSANPTATTSYVVTVTDSNGCTGNDGVNVTVNPLPSAHAESDIAICLGTSTPIGSVATSGTSPYSYAWSPTTGLSSATVASPSANPTATTSYVVTVTDANSCTGNDGVNVTLNPLPTAHAGNDYSISQGSSVFIGESPAATGGSSPYSYSWSPSSDLNSSSTGQPIANPSATTTYALTVTDQNGCSASDNIVLTVGAPPPPNIQIKAPIESYTNAIEGSDIQVGDSVVCTDGKFNAPDWNKIDIIYSSDNYVGFSFDPFSSDSLGFNFTCTADIEITYTDGNGNQVGPFTLTFEVNYDTAAGAEYQPKSMQHFRGAHNIKAKILSLDFDGVDYPSVPEVFQLVLEIHVARSYKMDCDYEPYAFYGLRNNQTQVEIQWYPIDGANEYEVEYTFKDWFDPNISNYRDHPSTTFSFDNQFINDATKITTTSLSYKFPLLYPSGFVFFRVRGVKYDHNGDRVFTKWNLQNYSITIHHAYVIELSYESTAEAPPHQNLFNWQSSINFAEDGKWLPKVNYFDGALYDRQDVTYSRQQETSIVGETIYDNQGRPAIKVLPTPSFEDEIKFHPIYNTIDDTSGYNRWDFDLGDCDGTAPPMDSISGSYKYYSQSNIHADEAPYKFIPSAQGYPFTVTEWTRDNTGRISRQSGVGKEFSLGNNHETKYYYGVPLQEDLNRLFGKEVGWKEHYLKNMVVDPNGQVSISYIDAHGRTIATSLAGTSPDGIDPLSSNVPDNTDYNLLAANQNYNSDDHSLTQTTSFLVEYPTDIELHYTVDPLAYTVDEECATDECYDCIYDLLLQMKSGCGELSPSYWDTTSNNPYMQDPFDKDSFNVACGAPAPGLALDTIIPSASLGNYTLEKKLTLNQEAIDFYKNHFLTTAGCVHDLDYFIDQFVDDIDASGCGIIDCASCTTAVGTHDVFVQNFLAALYPTCPSSTLGIPASYSDLVDWATTHDETDNIDHAETLYEKALQKCAEMCHSENECEILLGQLKSDMRPGGQYAKFTVNTSTNEFEVPSEEIFNNTYTSGSTYSCSSDIFYGSYSVVLGTTFPEEPIYHLLTGDVQLDPNSPDLTDIADLTIKQFVENFNDSWLDQLIIYHPEYWYYTWCESHSDIFDYDNAMMLESDPSAALANGYFNPLNDPTYNSDYGDGNDPILSSADFNTSYSPDFATTNGAIDAMRNEMEHFFVDVPNGHDYSIWEMSYKLANCPNDPVSCTPLPLGTTTGCDEDLKNEWLIFRSMYQGLKKKYLDSVRNISALAAGYCNTVIGNNDEYPSSLPVAKYVHGFCEFTTDIENNIFYNKQRRALQFHNGNFQTNGFSGSSFNQTDISDLIVSQGQATCEGNADTWINTLEQSGCLATATQTQIDDLRAFFVGICSAAVDIDHPFGATDVPGGFTYMSVTYNSFQDAIIGILGSGTSCSSLMITSPGSYNNPTVLSTPVVYNTVDECVCDRIGELNTEFAGSSSTATTLAEYLAETYGTTITQEEIDAIQALCDHTNTCAYIDHPIIIPSVLGCGLCKDCNDIVTTTVQFFHDNQQFCATDPVGTPPSTFHSFYTNYMNNALGYNLTFEEYENFLVNCTGDQNLIEGIFTDGLFVTIGNNSDPKHPVYNWLTGSTSFTTYSGTIDDANDQLCAQPWIDPPPVSEIDPCYQLQLDAAYANANAAYTVYLDSLSTAFVNNYVEACKNVHETLTMKKNVSEYHYTLYYYDQAGNLLKTAPPLAVVPDNSSTHWGHVDEYRSDPTNATYAAYTDLIPSHDEDLTSRYWFNVQNQPLEQKTPDGGTTNFWYDQNGRIILSQNAQQNADGVYSYTLYDAQSRIIEVGQISGSCINTALTDLAETASFDFDALDIPSALTVPALNIKPDIYQKFLTAVVCTSSVKSQVTHTFYDATPYADLKSFHPYGQENLRSRVACIIYAPDGNLTAYRSATHFSYDISGNVKILVQQNTDLFAEKEEFKRIDYDYDLVSGKVNYVYYESDSADQYMHHYIYDEDNKLTRVETGTDFNHLEVDGKYTYYDHGPVSRLQLGSLNVQGLDYAYTLQGWLKLINSTELNPEKDMGGDETVIASTTGWSGYTEASPFGTSSDLIALSLNYYKGDYAPIGLVSGTFENPESDYNTSDWSNSGNTNSPDLFNGNIRAMSVALSKFNDQKPFGYSYHYDQLNRLRQMDVFNNYNASTHNWGSGGSALPDYHEFVTYDANGNIKKYQRNKQQVSSTAYTEQMDSLVYNYYSGNNQLKYVEDNISGHPGGNDIDDQLAFMTTNSLTYNYKYDNIGNLTEDKYEDLNIHWNVYGKITKIVKADTTFTFAYDPMGNRISKGVVDNSTHDSTVTYYIRDAQGNILANYTKNPSDLIVCNDFIIYGSSRLGRFKMNKTTYVNHDNLWSQVQLGYALPMTGVLGYSGTLMVSKYKDFNIYSKREYELTNHLGNVLATVGGGKNATFSMFTTSGIPIIGGWTTQLITMQDYYPFGMLQPGRQYSATTSSGYKFGYQGSLKDNDLFGTGNSYSTQFRELDSRLGRWWSVDPEHSGTPWESPYASMNNYPVGVTDVLGNTGGHPSSNPSIDNPISTTAVSSTSTTGASPDLIHDAQIASGQSTLSAKVPDLMESWSESTNLLSQISYGVVDAAYTTAQNLGGKQISGNSDAFHLNGEATTPTENVNSFVCTASIIIPTSIGISTSTSVETQIIESTQKQISPNVQKVLNTLDEITSEGGTIKKNALSPNQEINMTIEKGNQKLDFRIESHTVPEKFGGNGLTPERHMNVDLYPNKNALPNSGHKILPHE